NHDTAAFAVETQPMQDALQVAVVDATDRQLDAAMGAAIMDDAWLTLGIAPSDERFAQHRETDGLIRGQLFGLQDRIPVVSQALGQAGGKVGRDLPDIWVSRLALTLSSRFNRCRLCHAILRFLLRSLPGLALLHEFVGEEVVHRKRGL